MLTGESKANGVLMSPQWVVPKVIWSDEVEHTLHKGALVVTPAMHHGWEILVVVSHP